MRSIAQGTPLGPYVIRSLLGKGGMGEVYRAHDTRLDRLVAIKVLRDAHGDEAGRERFFREARIVARLRHPNVIAIFDVGEYDEAPYIVMELVEGPTLARLIASREPLAYAQKLGYAIGICDGLTHAHERGIVHRDVKPSNVLIDGDRARLADFGIAREASRVTMTSISGTVNYVAPEHLTGAAGDHRSDLFSLGAVLYELMTGLKAFPGSMADGVLFRILHEPAPALPPGAAPDGLDRIVSRALEKDPSRRFQSAAEFREALARVAETAYGETATAVAGTAVLPIESSFRRRLLEASTPADIRRLQYEVEAHLALHQHDVDARMLSDDISRALARAADAGHALPVQRPARSMLSRRTTIYGASLGILLIAASTFTLIRVRTGQPPQAAAVSTAKSTTSVMASGSPAETLPAVSAAPALGAPGAAPTTTAAVPLALAPRPRALRQAVIPAGQTITVRLVTPVSTATAKVNDPIETRIAQDVTSGGQVVIPAGTVMLGLVTGVETGDTGAKPAMLRIVFTTLSLGSAGSVRVQIDPVVYTAAAARGGETAPGGSASPALGWIALPPRPPRAGRAVTVGTGDDVTIPEHAATLPAGAMARLILREPVTIGVTDPQPRR